MANFLGDNSLITVSGRQDVTLAFIWSPVTGILTRTFDITIECIINSGWSHRDVIDWFVVLKPQV